MWCFATKKDVLGEVLTKEVFLDQSVTTEKIHLSDTSLKKNIFGPTYRQERKLFRAIRISFVAEKNFGQ
jgi:hypothetical protein